MEINGYRRVELYLSCVSVLGPVCNINIQLNCFETLKITQNSKASNGLLKIT